MYAGKVLKTQLAEAESVVVVNTPQSSLLRLSTGTLKHCVCITNISSSLHLTSPYLLEKHPIKKKKNIKSNNQAFGDNFWSKLASEGDL